MKKLLIILIILVANKVSAQDTTKVSNHQTPSSKVEEQSHVPHIKEKKENRYLVEGAREAKNAVVQIIIGTAIAITNVAIWEATKNIEK